MSNTLEPCACKSVLNLRGPEEQDLITARSAVDHCPLHKAAPDLLEALEIIHSAAKAATGRGGMANYGWQEIYEDTKAAIALATPKATNP